MKRRQLVTATLFTGLAVTLAACGVGSSSHVVASATTTSAPPASPITTTTVVAGTVAGSTPVSIPSGVTTTTAPSTALSPQTLDQVAADLGALDNSLNTANSDLNNPRGDS